MWEIILAAGWPIWPLIFASIIALAIIGERFWSLRVEIIAPSDLLPEVQNLLNQGTIKKDVIAKIKEHSLLGEIFASALVNSNTSAAHIKEAIEESGRSVSYKLEKYLSTLGTIAAVAPLLGLLGTVIGMVDLFSSFTNSGHDVAIFARGISVALYNTAAGIVVAVPAMIFYRFFRSKVDDLIFDMEQQALKLIESMGVRK
ncbi:TolQ Biopolymer transport proteins [Candidatus Methylopumilus universalis]|jgi:biopolymer transport protein ExbB|uniref:MotA/TolQ/ExbB proton channel family protein n=1 Tax=Candidatus Methylopumilus TaxID=1679002 RepID=UPI000EDDB809|nr:MotA/TolQ/ExbB proton channel family protein [Candidatus Methylopumilus planktonicus]GBL31896.1 putative biopolymer transport protein ExbB-like 3 [Methylophilaceae bacterium]QDD00033.1 MotA/TolQ/ExbB proton channel family protein [Candidatus Methylopumilus planktonicus]QDD01360.1 MotA/TolQ/ExbB proton channel family protein [Candidatus Methylopumilus planktonicus]QDD06621.1 MotA/TolQ/ExbB proton channel family protein [Candidatus Methylopumilus planktonicus]QDD07957.1 MotA/TolQ/ExbB proton 